MAKRKECQSFQSDESHDYSGIRELLDSETGLAGYNNDIVQVFLKKLKITQENVAKFEILEFGAGTGVLAQIWRRKLGVNPICIEIDPQCLIRLNLQGFTTHASLDEIQKTVSIIYTSNVLEHIEDDLAALKQIREKLNVGGQLAIYVPALPILFSGLDESIGHFRRYRRKELIQKVRLAGFDVRECFFNDSMGVLGSLALRLFGYKNKLGLGSMKSLVFYDQFVYPISKLLDRIFFKHVVGKNLFLFATAIED